MLDAILFDKKALLYLWQYVMSVDTEICGLGRIQKDQFDMSHVTDIIILPQEVGSVDANVTASDMEKFFEGIPDEQKPEWCFHWHTHPTFSTTPSHTDLNNWKHLTELFDVFVPMIFNQYGEYDARAYHSSPVKGYYEFKNIWLYEWRKRYNNMGRKFGHKNQIEFILAMIEMQDEGLTAEDIAFIKNEVATKVKKKETYPQYGGVQGGHARTAANLQRHPNNYHQNGRNPANYQQNQNLTSGRTSRFVGDEEYWDALMQEQENDDAFISHSSETGGDSNDPFQWTVIKVIAEAVDNDYHYDDKTETFYMPGFAEHYTMVQMRQKLKELMEVDVEDDGAGVEPGTGYWTGH